MNVVLDYDPRTDGAPLSVGMTKPGVWTILCRCCGRTQNEPTLVAATGLAHSHIYLSEMWGCGASKAATIRNKQRNPIQEGQDA